MFACGCASPDCMANGCAQMRRFQQTTYAPMPYHPETFAPPPLTEQRIREIVREAMEQNHKPI